MTDRSTITKSRLLLCAASLSLVMTAPSSGRGEPLRQLRVDAPGEALADELAARGFDLLPRRAGAAIDIVADAEDFARLDELGVVYSVVARGRPLADLTGQRALDFADYPRAAAIIASLGQTAAAYPAIARLVDLTSDLGSAPTSQGRNLWAIKLSDNPGDDEDEPAVLILSGMHAREIINPLIALDAVDRLTSGYGHEPTITRLVDSYQIWVAPLWNPDGYEYVFTTDNLWRKNLTPFADGVGVDLNRNFPFGWDSECRGSTSVDSRFYRGPTSASEAETETLLALTRAERFAKVIEFHSAGREVVWGSPCSVNPFEEFLASEAAALAAALGYYQIREPAADGQHHQWQLSRLGTLSFLVETSDEWQPPYADALVEVERAWPGIMWMLDRPLSISGHVTDATTGEPLVATISFAGIAAANGEENRSGGAFGRYHAVLPSGDHAVEFSAPGYSSATRAVTVSATSALFIDVALTPLPDTPDLLYGGAAADLAATSEPAHDPVWGCGCDSRGSPAGSLLFLVAIVALRLRRQRPTPQ